MEHHKKYNTIVIDPPWDISMTGKVKREENRSETLPYKTMTIEEIKNIPLKDIANIGCHIYCWTTNKMLHETFHILESWGVNFHLVMPMVKPSGIAPCMGYVFASEFVILGFFGKPMQKFNKIGKLNWIKFFNGANKHSSKPDEFYKLVEEMSPAPRIDIFARNKRKGWDVFGDEVESDVQLIANPSTSATPTFVSQKEFNMGLEVQKSKISSPKSSPTEITSPNPNIRRNSDTPLKSMEQLK